MNVVTPDPNDRCGWLPAVVVTMYALWLPALRVLAWLWR